MEFSIHYESSPRVREKEKEKKMQATAKKRYHECIPTIRCNERIPNACRFKLFGCSFWILHNVYSTLYIS